MISKTLYISDLDGTLLNSNAELSEYTKTELNRLISAGVNISIATARTAATCTMMFDGININIPVILMNGVCIYDFKRKHYLKTENMDLSAKNDFINIINDSKLEGFLYAVEGDNLSVFYAKADTERTKEFIKEREAKYGKIFTRVNNFSDCANRNIVYYSVTGDKDELEIVQSRLLENKNVHTEFYADNYSDSWYLEVCAITASKYNAVSYLREKYGFEYIVGFGDNFNDIPLFKGCDESYAVSNARDELKLNATGIIGSNRDDGVVRKIAELTGL